jgi:hypothetical protein
VSIALSPQFAAETALELGLQGVRGLIQVRLDFSVAILLCFALPCFASVSQITWNACRRNQYVTSPNDIDSAMVCPYVGLTTCVY